MHFLVSGGLAGYVLRTIVPRFISFDPCIVNWLTNCISTNTMHSHSVHSKQTNKTQHAAYRTGSSSDVCRARNKLEGRKFVVKNRLYYHFHKNSYSITNCTVILYKNLLSTENYTIIFIRTLIQ